MGINVLIALVDPGHEHHLRAKGWLDRVVAGAELVTCSLTEDGFVWIYGHPSYPGGPGSPGTALDELRVIRNLTCHRFIADSLSIDDPSAFHALAGIGPRQVAVRNQMAFVTFDRGCAAPMVVVGPAALVVIA